jgi:serine/threonine protein phosphatase 1
MKSRIFVIGDVHGCALTLQHLIFKVIRLRTSDRLYFLGDLIDRGPRSMEVIDTLKRLKSAGYYIKSVKGNHEEMLLDACCNMNRLLWLENGGWSTLHSFGVGDASAIPSNYLKFIATFPHYILLDEFVLCHAGINCTTADPFADTHAMLWGRDLNVIPEKIGNRKVICGHTVQNLAGITASLDSHRIFLDGGCVFNQPGFPGMLVALEIGTMKLFHTRNIDG